MQLDNHAPGLLLALASEENKELYYEALTFYQERNVQFTRANPPEESKKHLETAALSKITIVKKVWNGSHG